MKIKRLINDFYGGRKKSNEESQEFYDLAQYILQKLQGKPYSKVTLFTKYLKEISKDLSCINILGREEVTH